MISRSLVLPQKRSFFLFGPRQTGKSTLIKATFPAESTLYYNLLHSETYRRLCANPEVFRAEVLAAIGGERPATHVVIDEVQRVPALLDEVHSLIESTANVYFIMSGSSARKLKRANANMLGGRAWTLNLFPLSFHEIKTTFLLDRELRYGLLPSVYMEGDETAKREILRSYVATYLKEEIEIEAQLRNIGAFLRFLPLAASHNGQIINHSAIARDLAMSSVTVGEYFSILEETLLGYYLLPFGRSIRKRLRQHPKFFFFDTGVVSALTGKLTVPIIPATEEQGWYFEHFLLNEIRQINDYFRRDWTIAFYRTESGAEVDCIIEKPDGRVIAIEFKATENPASAHCRGLRSFKEFCPQAELLLFCRCPRKMEIGPVTVLPWHEGLELIAGL